MSSTIIGSGDFNIAHNITCDADGWVYVADRENHRVQVFDGNGRFETQWNNLHRPSGLYMTQAKSKNECLIFYIAEIGRSGLGIGTIRLIQGHSGSGSTTMRRGPV